MDCTYVPCLAERLTQIRKYSPEDIIELVSRLELQLLSKLPNDYLDSLDSKDRDICFLAALLCYCVTGGTQIPREMQLRAVLADQQGKDYLVAAGTGSGKTLVMVLSMSEGGVYSGIIFCLDPVREGDNTRV
jgi:ATP-dependent helicase YprA (DUF1998 family)